MKPIDTMTDEELRQSIRPLFDNIFVELLPLPERRIAVGDYTAHKNGLGYGRRAKVLAVGPGRYHRPFKKTQCIDKFVPLDDVRPGDTVILQTAAGTWVDPRRPQFLLCVRNDYHAVEEA